MYNYKESAVLQLIWHFFFAVKHKKLHIFRFAQVNVKSASKPSGPSSQVTFVAWINQDYFYSPLDGMLVYHRVTSQH